MATKRTTKATKKTAESKPGTFIFAGEEFTLKDIQGDIVTATDKNGVVHVIAKRDVKL